MSGRIGKAGTTFILSYITPHLIDFLNKCRQVNSPKICKISIVPIFILQIWSALPISADGLFPPIPLAFCMFTSWIGKADQRGEMVKKYQTSPINLAVASGNGNKEFYRETTSSNRKKITLDRQSPRLKLNYCLLPDPLNFRYHLPLTPPFWVMRPNNRPVGNTVSYNTSITLVRELRFGYYAKLPSLGKILLLGNKKSLKKSALCQ